jgi:hypothetical protein
MPSSRPWVARVTLDGERIIRSFVNGQIDFGDANSKASRGAVIWFHLQVGFAYECFGKESWATRRRWFIVVEESGCREVSEAEMREWLKGPSALPF